MVLNTEPKAFGDRMGMGYGIKEGKKENWQIYSLRKWKDGVIY